MSWHYGFGAAIGGGEYDRKLLAPAQEHRCYIVGAGHFETLQDAVAQWHDDMQQRRAGNENIPPRAIIEIAAHGCQIGGLVLELGQGETLILRAADRHRPVIWLADVRPAASDALAISGASGSRFVMDGLVVAQRGVEISGPLDQVLLRHCTLVPPERLQHAREGAPSVLTLNGVSGDVALERSVLGPITVSGVADPTRLRIEASIVDAAHDADYALSGDGEGSMARAALTVRASTVFGAVATHCVELAENSMFSGQVQVARRQPGCMRFCYVPEGSRTPQRYHCQPDLVLRAAEHASAAFQDNERDRVRPLWTSRTHGHPAYGQLHPNCAAEIRRGADDESELGAMHDLYLPQREEALATRLVESIPVAAEAGLLFAT